MRAYIVDQAGGSFRKVDLALPKLASDQVLVRIHASGLNPLDTKIRAGKAAHAKQPLHMAGVVEEIGTGVASFKPGDEVYAWLGRGWLAGHVGRFRRRRCRSAGAQA